jgi:3-oxoacyl-[acyl-carrier-protein] synthase II
MTNPREDGEGVSLCIQNALESAGIPKEEVTYINAHATSTPAGDLCEISSLRSVFGAQLEGKIQVNATKSMIGHALGAAGAMGCIATVQAMRTGRVHPTINIKDPEEAVRHINIVCDQEQPFNFGAGIANAFGFGGHNSSLVFAPFS